MTKSTPVTIRLMGKPYTLKCLEDEADTLQEAAATLQQHIEKTKKQFNKLDDFETLLLAALEVSHEHVSGKKEQTQQNTQLTQLIASLERKINAVTSDS